MTIFFLNPSSVRKLLATTVAGISRGAPLSKIPPMLIPFFDKRLPDLSYVPQSLDSTVAEIGGLAIINFGPKFLGYSPSPESRLYQF